jgi:hypothetical protein
MFALGGLRRKSAEKISTCFAALASALRVSTEFHDQVKRGANIPMAGDDSCEQNTDEEQGPPLFSPSSGEARGLREDVRYVGGAVANIGEDRQQENDQQAVERDLSSR